jgi:hypothetical protein
MSPLTISPVVGLIPMDPEQYTMPLATMAWLYIPGKALGAFSVLTARLDCMMCKVLDGRVARLVTITF